MKDAYNASATISFQEYCTEKTLKYIASKGQETVAPEPADWRNRTDKFLMEVSRLTGKPIPDALTKERGRLVDAIATRKPCSTARNLRFTAILTDAGTDSVPAGTGRRTTHRALH